MASLILATCTWPRRINETNYQLYIDPPGGIKLTEKLYYDQTEIRNIDWLEYMSWTSRVFGRNSAEYVATIPDTTDWSRNEWNSKDISYILYYYEDCPVKGVSQKQVSHFSQWRTNQVFEILLSRFKVLEWDPFPTKENYFTVDKYFEGEYKNITPNPDFKYYFHFRLPTVDEWKMAVHFADSVHQNCDKCKIICIENPPVSITSNAIPDHTEKVYTECSSKKIYPIFHLRGNVCEWTADSAVCVGGSWKESEQTILSQDTFHVNTPNSSTGFRNVIEVAEWTK